MKTVAIFGLGLIGGSFALALRKAGFSGEILGVSSPISVGKALELGAIDRVVSLEQAAKSADLLYLAQPISTILQIIPRLDHYVRPEALVTDAGSTKRAIVQQAANTLTRCQFLGGHPLAGKETRGMESASGDLFEGRTYVLTPVQATALESGPAREFLTLLRNMACVPIIMNAQEHDETLSYTSHLPQLASTAFAALLNATGESTKKVFGPALIDHTRLALSPYMIWRDILETNRAEVDHALATYIEILTKLRSDLNEGSIERYFVEGNEYANAVRRET